MVCKKVKALKKSGNYVSKFITEQYNKLITNFHNLVAESKKI